MRAYKPTRNIFAGFRAWPKTLPDFAFGKARLAAISECHPTLAAEDPFRPGRDDDTTPREARAPASRDSSKASTPPDAPTVPERAVATLSDTQTSWRRI